MKGETVLNMRFIQNCKESIKIFISGRLTLEIKCKVFLAAHHISIAVLLGLPQVPRHGQLISYLRRVFGV